MTQNASCSSYLNKNEVQNCNDIPQQTPDWNSIGTHILVHYTVSKSKYCQKQFWKKTLDENLLINIIKSAYATGKLRNKFKVRDKTKKQQHDADFWKEQ